VAVPHPRPLGPSAVGRLALAVATLAAFPAMADEAEQDSPQDLSLQALLDPAIWVATRSALPVSQAPAVVTVVTADEIQTRGYTSLADVLRSVPGFYDVYDGVTHNVGIRGVNGGQNASGSGLKLMIDGLAVDFTPSTGNFFGEELIPIEAVERVEVIRGPASALYGADAFLGTINVVTRSGESTQGLRVVGHGALVRKHLGGGGGLVMGGKSGPLDVLLAGSYLYLDRSGLALPGGSPILISSPTLGRGPSREDTAEPATLLAKLALSNVLGGTLTFLGTIQRLDAHGAFQPFGPLDQRTRTTALNQNYRLAYEVAPVKSFAMTLSVDHFDAAPTGDARVGLGRADYLMIPSLAASGWSLSAEGHLTPHPLLALTAGGDILIEDSDTSTYDQLLLAPVLAVDGSVLRTAGTIIPGEKHGQEIEVLNLGAFAQARVTPSDQWSAIVGLRLDRHNIYGTHVSARTGLVFGYRALSVKLLYGSSFKAPSADQLNARPVAFGGVLGNPELRAQTAHSGEVAVGVRLPRDLGNVEANGFVTRVLGRVEFLPTGSFIIANNTQDEWLTGGELSAHLLPLKHLRATLLASVARTVGRSGTIEGLLGKPVVTNPLFPKYQAGGILDYTLPWAGIHLGAELSFVGPRETSFSNALQRGGPYEAKAYLYSALSASVAGRFVLRDRETRLALRMSDALDRRWGEPGFGGVDVPTQGRTAFLTVVQAF
jgi:outer membrane receptor for ferrienterochelin and colicins